MTLGTPTIIADWSDFGDNTWLMPHAVVGHVGGDLLVMVGGGGDDHRFVTVNESTGVTTTWATAAYNSRFESPSTSSDAILRGSTVLYTGNVGGGDRLLFEITAAATSGTPLTSVSFGGAWHTALAEDAEGNVWATSDEWRTRKYSSTGTLLREYNSSAFGDPQSPPFDPRGLTFHGGLFYAASSMSYGTNESVNGIWRMDPADEFYDSGSALWFVPWTKIVAGPLYGSGLAIHGGTIYYSDYGGKGIWSVPLAGGTPTLEFQGVASGDGDVPGEWLDPYDVTVSNGYLYVGDVGYSRIYRWALAGPVTLPTLALPKLKIPYRQLGRTLKKGQA
jgi:hypothetical protein